MQVNTPQKKRPATRIKAAMAALLPALLAATLLVGCAGSASSASTASNASALAAKLSEPGNAVITLNEAVELTQPITVSGTKTLQGTGSVTAAAELETMIDISASASLTVDGIILACNQIAQTAVTVQENASYLHAAGEITDAKGTAIVDNGSVEFKNGKITKAGNAWLAVGKGAKATVSGGEFKNARAAGISVESKATLNISGTPVFDGAGTNLVANRGTANITGGTYTNSVQYAILNQYKMDISGSTDVGKSKTKGGLYNFNTGVMTVDGMTLHDQTSYHIYNAGTMTVKNSTMDNSKMSAINNRDSGKLTMENVTMTNSASHFIYNAQGQVELENVSMTKAAVNGIKNKAGTITGNNVTVSDTKKTAIANEYADKTNLTYGSTTLTNVTVTNSGSYSLLSYGGELSIKNAEFGASAGTNVWVRSGKATLDTVNIQGSNSTNKMCLAIGSSDFEDAVVVLKGASKLTGASRGISNYGTLTMYGGTVAGNSHTGTHEYGAGIWNQGTFNLVGGTLSGNRSIKSGAGVYNKGEFNMTGGTISGNTAKELGGGVYNTSEGTFTFTGGVIEKNATKELGGGGVQNLGIMYMDNKALIQDNKAATVGAGISNSDVGTLYFRGGIVTRNWSDQNGGGISNAGTAEITGGDVRENHGGKGGGGVYNKGTLKMTGGAVQYNVSESLGGGVSNSGTFLFTGGEVSANRTTSQGGGGIYNSGAAAMSGTALVSSNCSMSVGGGVSNGISAFFTLDGGTITKNTAVENGAGISNAGELWMHGGLINLNNAGKGGGGVYNKSGFTLNGGAISDNTTQTGGGGVSTTVEMRMYGGSITGNSAVSSGGGINNTGKLLAYGGSIADNKTNSYGGGIYGSSDSDNTFAKLSLERNSAANNGGGIYVSGSKEYLIDLNNVLFGTGANVNTTTGTAPDYYGNATLMSAVPVAKIGNTEYLTLDEAVLAANAGETIVLVRNQLLASDVVINKDLTITDDGTRRIITGSASSRMITVDGGNVKIIGTTTGGIVFDGERATKTRSYPMMKVGNAATLTLGNNVTLKDSAGAITYGAGVQLSNTAELIVDGATFTNLENTAASTNPQGGAVRFASSTAKLTVNSGNFTGNAAGDRGGAIYATGSVTINGGCFSGNLSGGSGGALYATSTADLKITGGEFTANTSAASGGAIYTSAPLTVNAAFAQNTAGTNGGAICATAQTTISGGTFTNNRGTENGGAIYGTGAITVADGNFTGNSATVGGAIYEKNVSLLSVNAGLFSQNTASDKGGAIAIENEGLFSMVDGAVIFTGNTAPTAPDYYGTLPAGPVAKIERTGTSYDTFAEAITAAQADDKIILTGNAVAGVAITKNLTITDDGTCRTLTGPAGTYLFDIQSSASAATTVQIQGTASGGIVIDGGSADAIPVTRTKSLIYLKGGAASRTATLNLEGNVAVQNAYAGATLGNGISLQQYSVLNATGTTFQNMRSDAEGGAIRCASGSAVMHLTDCSFLNNAGTDGGAVYSINTIVVTNCNFTGNTATQYGGALFVRTNAKLTVDSAVFHNNMAVQKGGAIAALDSKDGYANVGFSYNSDTVVFGTDALANSAAGDISTANFAGTPTDTRVAFAPLATSIPEPTTTPDVSPISEAIPSPENTPTPETTPVPDEAVPSASSELSQPFTTPSEEPAH